MKTEQTNGGAQAPQIEAKPGKSPATGEVKSAVRDELNVLNAQVVSLTAEVTKLRANQKPEVVKKPVSTETLLLAIAKLEGLNRNALAKAEKDDKTGSATLNLSLASVLEFQPEMTKEQRALWGPRRDAMRNAHSRFWKERSGIVIAHLKRATRNGNAVMGGAIKVRKTDNAVTGVSLRANKLAKPLARTKGKGKNAAKPAQVAAKVEKPGNANPPAVIS